MLGIAPLDVVVVDADLLWRVEHMNLVRGRNVKDFADLDDAVAELTDGQPAVVVVGPDAADEAVHDVVDLRSSRPEVRLLLVCDPDPILAIEARRVGVDVLAPGDVDALLAAIDGWLGRGGSILAAPAGDERPAIRHVVVVTSAKGGEGVTTVAANLAASMAHAGARRVALAEGDPDFGDLTMLLGAPEAGHRRIHGPPDAGTAWEMGVVHERTGMRLVVPRVETGSASAGQAAVVVDTLAALQATTDVIVLDAPLELVLDAELTELASLVFLVTTERGTSLKNAVVASKALWRPRNLHLVLNETGRHGREPKRREIEHAVGLDVWATLPYDSHLDRAGASTAPSVLAPSRSRFHREMDAFARRVAEIAAPVRA